MFADRRFASKKSFVLLSLVGISATAFAQVAPQTACCPQPVAPASAGYAPAAPGAYAGQVQYTQQPHSSVGAVTAQAPENDRLEDKQLLTRGVTLGIVGAGGAYGAAKVSGAARGMVNFGKVGGVPGIGSAIASVPVIGGVAAKGSVVPTTLGQVPVMGSVVKSVPGVGPIIAGPADPIVVGAVAVDTYVIPKYSPVGYTKSSAMAATNDFNTPPKLRNYVNYLPPVPYSHPPIYESRTRLTDLHGNVPYIDAIPQVLTDSVDSPGI